MFIFGNLLYAITYILNLVISIYFWIIIIYVILSWVNADTYNPIVRIINSLAHIVIYPVRKVIPTRIGMLDFAPFIAILALMFIQKFLIATLFGFARRLR